MDEVQFDEGGAVVQMRTASAVAANRKETKDKKGEIVLVKPARVGDTILLPGTYTFQHVVSAGQNIATFTGPRETWSQTMTKVNCTNEPLNQKATHTSVLLENVGGVDRIKETTIAGEDVVHFL
jgi:hypothetical protein